MDWKGFVTAVGPPTDQLQPQDVTPDPAAPPGPEPAVSRAAVPAIPSASIPMRTAPAKPGRKSWVDHPVTVATIMALALPTLLEQLLSAAIGFTDTWLAGHTATSDVGNAASAAAVGTMTYIQWFAGLMTAALGTGASAIVSRSIGAKRFRLANRVAGTVCVTAFLIGIGVALFFYIAAWPLVYIFGLRDAAAPGAVSPAQLGVDYLRIMCWTICFQTAGQIGMACLRGAGDTLRPMLITFAITLVNGFFSTALTFGWWGFPAWGIKGNATGTLLAFVIAGVLTFAFLLYGDAGLKLRLRHLRVVPHLLGRIARIGLPSWVEGMVLWTGQAAVVMLVMHQVDAAVGVSGATMAAHNATLRIESLAFLPGFGFGIACAALVGQYLGAKKPHEAARAVLLCTRLALLTMTLAALPMVFIPGIMLRWMVNSSSVAAVGLIPLIIAGLAQPGFAVAIIKSSALKGAGETLPPMYATFTGMGGRVVVVLIAMFFLARSNLAQYGLIAVWVCIFFDLNFRAVFLEFAFRRGRWKQQRV